MKYGQEFRFGYDEVAPRDKMAMIADAGFDGIMTWWGHRFARRDGKREEIACNARECGLELFAFHASFQHTPEMWGRDHFAEKALANFISNVEDCDKFGCPNLVVHVSLDDVKPTNIEAGLENFSRLFSRAEQLGISVAIENTRFTSLNKILLENITSKAYKVCYDSGHDNWMGEYENLLDVFQGKICVTHLHDNYRQARKDSHFLIGDGDVDFATVAKKLKRENLQAICLESRNSPLSKYCNLSPQEYLALSLQKVKELFD